MSNKNNSKGAAKLASVIQRRMEQVIGGKSSVSVDRGEIMDGNKMRLYSIPDAILDKDDYSVCLTIQSMSRLKAGDQVLVLWTFDGEPVVIDKIVEADKL